MISFCLSKCIYAQHYFICDSLPSWLHFFIYFLLHCNVLCVVETQFFLEMYIKSIYYSSVTYLG